MGPPGGKGDRDAALFSRGQGGGGGGGGNSSHVSEVGENLGGSGGWGCSAYSVGGTNSISPTTNDQTFLSPSRSMKHCEASLGSTECGGRECVPPSPFHNSQRKAIERNDVYGDSVCRESMASPLASRGISEPQNPHSAALVEPSVQPNQGGSRDRYDTGRSSEKTSLSDGAFAKTLSFRQHLQDSGVPRRPSKSRPGRGKAPLAQRESIAASPPPGPKRFFFKQSDSIMSPDVV